VSGERRRLRANWRGLLPHGFRHLRVSPRGRSVVAKAMFARCTASHFPSARPVGFGALTRPQRATWPLGGPEAGGPHYGVDGDTGMVVGRTSDNPRLDGGGQTAVVGRGQGTPRPWHAAGLPQLTSLHLALVLRLKSLLTRVITYRGRTTMPTGTGRRAPREQAPPACRHVICTRSRYSLT